CGTLQLCSFVVGTRQSLTLALTSSLQRLSPHLVTSSPLCSPRHSRSLTVTASPCRSFSLSPRLLTSSSSSRSRNPALRSLCWRQKAHRRQKSSSISASAPSGQSGGGGRLLGRGLGTSYP
ncbi:hypothetical protein HN51_042799, partial [Arachis hypogaea]